MVAECKRAVVNVKLRVVPAQVRRTAETSVWIVRSSGRNWPGNLRLNPVGRQSGVRCPGLADEVETFVADAQRPAALIENVYQDRRQFRLQSDGSPLPGTSAGRHLHARVLRDRGFATQLGGSGLRRGTQLGASAGGGDDQRGCRNHSARHMIEHCMSSSGQRQANFPARAPAQPAVNQAARRGLNAQGNGAFRSPWLSEHL
jgi:hypothetical protein